MKSVASEVLFITAVCATSLVVMPGMTSGFELGKVFWILTVVELWFWVRLVRGSLAGIFGGRPEDKWVWLWLAVTLVFSALLGGDAVFGGYWRRQGWWLMVHMIVLTGLLATTPVPRKIIYRIVSVTIGLTVVSGYLTAFVSGGYGGTIGEWTNWSLLSVFLFIVLFHGPRFRKLSVVALPGLFLGGSRAAILALGLVGVGRARKSWRLVLGAGLLGILTMWSLVKGFGGRTVVWWESLVIWGKSPLTGVGFDNFQSAISRQMLGQSLDWTLFDHPHNMFLWLLISTGAIGTTLVTIWLVKVFLASPNSVWKELAIATLIFGLFEPWLTATWVYFMFFIGCMSFPVRNPAKKEGFEADAGLQSIRVIWIACLAVVFWWFGVWTIFREYWP